MPLVNTLRDEHGVGPVCHELDIAPSTYYRHQHHRRHPERRSQRVQRDDLLKPEIQRVYDENHSVYGVHKVWRQLLREGISVARWEVDDSTRQKNRAVHEGCRSGISPETKKNAPARGATGTCYMAPELSGDGRSEKTVSAVLNTKSYNMVIRDTGCVVISSLSK